MRRSQQEQDDAAGGGVFRELQLQDGTHVVASVSVRSFARYKKSYQQYGYLQFKAHGKTVTRYIGKVTAETRADALKQGWEMVRKRGLAEAQGWSWTAKPSK